MEQRVRLQALGVRPERAEDVEEVRHEDDRQAIPRAGARRSNETDSGEARSPRTRRTAAARSATAAAGCQRRARPPGRSTAAPRSAPRVNPAIVTATNRAAASGERRVHGRRDNGRASRTSRVPRCRSPAIGVPANPTAKTRLSPTAIGWTKPSATEPVRLKTSPPPNWVNCWRDQAAVHHLLELLAERVVDDRQDAAPHDERHGHDEQPHPVGPPGMGEQGPVHAGTAGASRRRPRRTRGTPPRGGPARSSGRGSARRRWPPGTGPTSPSSRQVSERSVEHARR